MPPGISGTIDNTASASVSATPASRSWLWDALILVLLSGLEFSIPWGCNPLFAIARASLLLSSVDVRLCCSFLFCRWSSLDDTSVENATSVFGKLQSDIKEKHFLFDHMTTRTDTNGDQSLQPLALRTLSFWTRRRGIAGRPCPKLPCP